MLFLFINAVFFPSVGVLLTYFTIKLSFPVVVITYGVMFGWGVGIAYAVPIACAMRVSSLPSCLL